MNLASLGKTLADTLPRLKTRIQLSGLIFIVVCGALISLARPGDYVAFTLVGGIGVGLVVFGQLFHFLESFREDSRPLVFLFAFTAFLVFVFGLAALFVLHLQPKPGFIINQANAEPGGHVAVFTRVTDNSPEVGRTITLPQITNAEDVQYKFRNDEGVASLSASFSYIENSQRDQYPNGDFHQGVDWGHPWLSFNLSNPTASPLVYTSLQVDVIGMYKINNVILDVGEIDGYRAGKTQIIKIANRGWGVAREARLKLLVGREVSQNKYEVLSARSYIVDLFDDGGDADITDIVPSNAIWNKFKRQSTGDGSDGYLTLIGKLEYTSEDGTPKHETFRNTIYQTGSGGGNIPWSGYFNIELPDDPKEFPLVYSLSECIAAKSASKIRAAFVAKRSAHYSLKLTIKEINGESLIRMANIDVLVPRPVGRKYKIETGFRENPAIKGCT